MKLWKYILGLLLLITTLVFIAVIQSPDKNLHIIACNVGQGDAVLIVYGKTQILTDGGPDKSVLACLGRHMPFYDREIELVILTHSDADHSTGLIGVLQNYKVGKMVVNSIDPGTQVYEALRNQVGGRGIDVINPTAGMRLGLGLIYLDILNPTGESLSLLPIKDEGSLLSRHEVSKETNQYSVIYKLIFKNFSGLFPGDIPLEGSNELAARESNLQAKYIKIPHHGSNNGLTENLLREISPEIAVISVGENSWGFPKTEILQMLAKYNVKVLRTDEMGDVELVTDGEKYWIN